VTNVADVVRRYVVRILGYSLTLRLDFTKLLIMFVLALFIGFLWIRYRYLNKYSELKEVPYVLPFRS
jgi:hypothetical protein